MIIGIIVANNILDTLFDISSIRQDHYFCQFIGIADPSSYNDTLALIHHQLSEPHKGIIFDRNIPIPNDRLLIDSTLNELTRMSTGAFTDEAIRFTSSEVLDTKIRKALDTVITLAIQKEGFANDTSRSNFIATLMIWCRMYVDGLDFSDHTPPKCLFYGSMTQYEFYFLMLIAHIGIDVLYFNPTGDTTLDTLNTDHLCQKIILGPTLAQALPLMAFVSKGIVVEKVTTFARKATTELEQTLYQDTGIYKPWQFSDGTTRPLIMDSVIEDTLTYWMEPARLRPGFRTLQKTVYTPIFFSKINGVYKNHQDYFSLVEKLKSAEDCLFYETTQLTYTDYKQTRSINYHNLPGQNLPQNIAQYNPKELSALSLCLNPDQTINRSMVKTQVLYQKLLTFRSDVQEFILTKLEEVWAPNRAAFFQFPVTDTEKLRLMAAIFTAEDSLLNLIAGYDFTAKVPKIVLYLNKGSTFHTDDAMLLGLLHTMGFDIIILSPNGANTIELVISEKYINPIKLEAFVDDLPFKAPTKKGSFFRKLFK